MDIDYHWIIDLLIFIDIVRNYLIRLDLESWKKSKNSPQEQILLLKNKNHAGENVVSCNYVNTKSYGTD